MENLFSVSLHQSSYFKENFSDEFYHIFLFEGNGKLFVDFAEYEFSGKTIFFSFPLQN